VDPEVVVLGYLKARFGLPDNRAGTDTPADWANQLPFVQVETVGGTRRFNLHQPRTNVTVWATDKATASALASQIEDAFTYELPTSTGGFSLGLAGVTQSMTWRFYTNPAVQRYVGTYSLTIH
jgi:hypothetical protein